jgi:hypothetical protein
MKVSLACLSYDIYRRPSEPVRINAEFILKVSPHQIEEVAEALKRIELYLAGDVSLLRYDGSARCFYCGTKQDDNAKTCTQCGAPL